MVIPGTIWLVFIEQPATSLDPCVGPSAPKDGRPVCAVSTTHINTSLYLCIVSWSQEYICITLLIVRIITEIVREEEKVLLTLLVITLSVPQ